MRLRTCVRKEEDRIDTIENTNAIIGSNSTVCVMRWERTLWITGGP